MARPQMGRSGSRERDLGGRLPRRSTDGMVDLERRTVQDRMFALDLDRVLSGAPLAPPVASMQCQVAGESRPSHGQCPA